MGILRDSLLCAYVLISCLGERGRVVKALDPRSWGLGFDSCSKILGEALNPHRLNSPSCNRYQVERKFILCEWLQLWKIALHFAQGDENVRELVPMSDG